MDRAAAWTWKQPELLCRPWPEPRPIPPSAPVSLSKTRRILPRRKVSIGFSFICLEGSRLPTTCKALRICDRKLKEMTGRPHLTTTVAMMPFTTVLSH